MLKPPEACRVTKKDRFSMMDSEGEMPKIISAETKSPLDFPFFYFKLTALSTFSSEMPKMRQ
jgi:hypothetical protein